MWLSVIISCHNCRNYIKRLMNSLLVQDFDDMEIIISDDNSTDNFMEIVDKYKALLNIKYFPTNKHKYHCPGNTRLDGLSHATGEWVTFIDHDDELIPGSFKTVYDTLNNNLQYNIPFIFSPVQRVDVNGNSTLLEAITWLHGNFYKRQFLIDNDINFKEDLYGNEDLYFNNLVNGHLTGLGLSMLKMDKPIYKWYANPESLSNKQSGELEYTEKYFGDYLISNSDPHIICYGKYPEKKDLFRKELMQALLYTYFYYQRSLFNNGVEKSQQMLEDIRKTTQKISNELNESIDDIISELTSDINRYNESRQIITTLSGPFIENYSIYQFFKSL